MVKGSYKKIMEYSDEFEKLIAEASQKKEKATKLLAVTRSRIKEAKADGLNVSSATKLFKKGKTKLESANEIADFESAITSFEQAGKLVSHTKKQHGEAKDLIFLVKKQLAESEKGGIIIPKSQNMFQEAITDFQNGNYKNAISKAKSAIKIVETAKKSFKEASVLIENAYTKISGAKQFEVDTSDLEKLYNDAREHMEAEDYQTTAILAKECIEAVEKLEKAQLKNFRDRTTKTITELHEELEDANEFGADTTKLEDILKQIDTAFKNKEISLTLGLIEQFRNVINEVKSQHQYAMDKLGSAEGFIGESEQSGANLNKARQFLNDAKAAMVKFDYTAVETLCNSAIEEAERARNVHRKILGFKEQAEDVIKICKSKLNEIKELGIQPAGVESKLAKAEESFAKSEFHLAQKLATATIEECKTLQKQFALAQENLQKAQVIINDSKIYIDVSEANEILNESVNKMKEGLYGNASELADKAFSMIETIKSSGKPLLKFSFPDSIGFKTGAWGKLQLEVTNKGKVHGNDVKLEFSGPVESMGFSNISSIKAGETKKLDIGLRTQEIGEIPVNINTTYTNPLTKDKLDFQEVVWINAEAVGAVPTARADIPVAQAVVAATAAEPVEAEGEVKVVSEVEFFQGFVRLKVGVKNDQKTVITDAKLDIEYDDNTFRLDFIEPELERKGNKIIFGNIHPKEKRTVAFYLDPIICTESYIDGTLTFKNIYGELNTTSMKRRKAEVVCPILYTTENINTAMLKRLVNDELTIHDNKIYEIPGGIDIEKASSICKETIQGHDLKLVREFVEHDSEDPEIETWFYGITKVKKNKVIIKSSSRKKTNTIELFVACNNKQVLTGFLAELGHNFTDKLKELGVTKQPIYPLTDSETREQIAQTNTLLHHLNPDKTTLSLSKRGDEYEISFKTSDEGGEAAEMCEFIKVSPDSRQDLITQINQVVTVLNIFTCTRGNGSPPEGDLPGGGDQTKKLVVDEKIQDLSSLGGLLYGMFLPSAIQKNLELNKDPLILKTNDNEVPWELLHDGTDFLSLKVPVGRRLRSRERPRSNSFSKADKIRILFIANPTGDLDAAEKEVQYIQEHLGSNVDVEILKRHNATNSSILSAFRNGKYDIIHYAGHAEFDPKSPDESALISYNHRKIYAAEIKRILGGKPFVFLNACSSGVEKMCEDGESYTGSDTEGLASSFILGGAMGFIGSSWPMPDLSAGILASEFYNHFITGSTVGESLRRARLHLKEQRPKDINWMAFILYGDPTISLSRKVS